MQNNNEDYRILLAMNVFLTKMFIEEKMSLGLFSDILFTQKSLSEEEFLVFKEKREKISLDGAREKLSDFDEFERALKKFGKLVFWELYTIEQLYNVLFKGNFFERPPR